MPLLKISTVTCDDLVTHYPCEDLVTFRGRFYAVFINGNILATDPYSLEATPLLIPLYHRSITYLYLVPSGNDDLFLVEKIIPPTHVLDVSRYTCTVSRLDEKAGKWVKVSDSRDSVLFVGHFRNVSCLAKELPDGCGISGHSIVFINWEGYVTYAYEYGIHTRRWSRKNHVTIFGISPKDPSSFGLPGGRCSMPVPGSGPLGSFLVFSAV